jgi:hypothetical protein
MRKLLSLLALIPSLAAAQYSGPVYNPANVSITGGSVFATTPTAPGATVGGAQLGAVGGGGSLTFVDPARSAGNKLAYIDWGATNLVFGFAADNGGSGINALTITGGQAQGISGIASNSGSGVWAHTGNFSASGAINSSVGFTTKEAANGKQGVVTLVAGTATVSNHAITAVSRIFLTAQDGNTTGALRVSARTAGTSFVITSSNTADTGVVAYEIFEPGN